MTRTGVMLLSLTVSLGVTFTSCGCSNKSMSDPGLLQQNGIIDADDVAFVTINVAEAGGSNYLVTDKPTVERIYQLLNDAKRGSGGSKYFRPNMVTLVRKNGRTFSFAFGLYNPSLTQHYSSRAFVEFVKTDIVKSGKYVNRERVPPFSVAQATKIEGPSKRTTLPAAKAQQVRQVIELLVSAYQPYSSRTNASTWDAMAGSCTAGRPGFEVTLSKPVHFQTLVGWTGPEPPNGSDALNLVNLTVDRMLVYQGENRDLLLAFRSGNSWFVTGPFNPKDLHGRTPEGIYSELLSS